MINEYVRMALASIRAARFRSFLTMFGIIVGVSSVVTIVSLGEGVKQQVASQLGEVSESLIIVRPGSEQQARAFSLDGLKALSATNSGTLSEKDWIDIGKTEGVVRSAPIGIVSGVANYDGVAYDSGTVIASTPSLIDVLSQSVSFGDYFSDADAGRNVAIVGQRVAEDLFKENVPVGKSITIRDKQFIVQGVFEAQKSSTFSVLDINNAIVLPYESARQLGAPIQLSQIYIEADSPERVGPAAASIRATLKANHAGQEDFAVLEKDDALQATNSLFYQITLFITGVAVISFIVGGIGIMNIMFAMVSERTREIGIRKAIGATEGQILGQFVTEATVLSVAGGLFGIIASLLANAAVRVTTDLQPVVHPEIILIAVGVSIVTGIISGILPAAKAARKEPISALRSEV